MDSCGPPESAADSSANEAPSSRPPYGCHFAPAQTSSNPSTSEWSPASSAGRPCSCHLYLAFSVALLVPVAARVRSCISPLRRWSVAFPLRSHRPAFSTLSHNSRHPSCRGCVPARTPLFSHPATQKPTAVFSLVLQNCPAASLFPSQCRTQNKSCAFLPVSLPASQLPLALAALPASSLLLYLALRCLPGSFPSSAHSAPPRSCESPPQTASSCPSPPASAA